MKIKTRIGVQRRSVARSYKRRAFIALATFGMLAGFVGQTFTSVLFQYNDSYALGGWNWVAQHPGQMYEVSDTGSHRQQAVSKDGQTIVYASPSEVKISHDSGATWSVAHPSATKHFEFFTGVAVSANGQRIWVEAGYADPEPQTFVSSDGGVTWTQRGNDVNYTMQCDSMSAISNDGQIIVCADTISRDGGMTYEYLDWTPLWVSSNGQTMISDDYVSNDAGVTWSQLTTPVVPNIDWSTSQMSDDGQTIMMGTYNTYDWMTETVTDYQVMISKDGGTSWNLRSVPAGLEYPHVRMSQDGTKMYLFDNNDTHGGQDMWTSTDNGVSWQQRSTPIPFNLGLYNNLQVSNDGTMLTAFSYSGVYFRSNDGGATWSLHAEQRGVTPVTLSEDGSTIFGIIASGGETSDAGGIYPVRSTDNGTSWQYVLGNNIASVSAAFQVCSPDKMYGEASKDLSVSSDGQTFIMPGITSTGTDCYLRSQDGGATWATVTGPASKNVLRKIHVSANGQFMATTNTSAKPTVSTDGGASWTLPATALTFDQIQSISDDGQKMTAVTTSDVLLYTTNGGTNWTNISTVITSAFTGVTGTEWSGRISPDGSRLIASDGSSDYVYISTNNGVNWTRSTTKQSIDGGFNSYYGSWYVGQFSMSEDGMRIGASGGDGTVLTSVDGGVTFVKQDNIEGINYFWDINTLMSADGSTLLAAREDAYLAVAKYGFNPQAIQGISATAGVNSATVSWTVPALIDAADTIIAQEVSYRQAGASTWTSASQSIAPSATSYTVNGLTGGVQYEFRVRAQNADGGWTPWGRTFAPKTVIDLSSVVATGVVDSSDYALDANDDGTIWFAHDYYPCGNPGSCAASGWAVESSTDDGATWQSNPLSGLATIPQSTATPHELKISEDGQTILLSGATLYISRDGGATWSTLSSIGGGRWYTVDMSDNGQYMFASEWGGTRRIVMSSDNGQTWTNSTLPEGQDAGDMAHTLILNDGTAYASTYAYTSGPIYKSTDLGATWTSAMATMPKSLPMADMYGNSTIDGFSGLMLVDASNDEQHMSFIARYGFSENSNTVRYYTEDGGATWNSLAVATDGDAFETELLLSDDESYDLSVAFTPSGRAAYITGIETPGSHTLVFSNYARAFATPIAAPNSGNNGGQGGSSGGGASSGESGTAGAPNTGMLGAAAGGGDGAISFYIGQAILALIVLSAIGFGVRYAYRRRVEADHEA